jgi:hypothetical protein
MKYCRNLLFIVIGTLACLLVIACAKGDPNKSNESDPPATLEDSVAMLLGKWNLIKDSSTNIGDYYFTEGGPGGTKYSPTPGVYFGVATDNFDFKSDGTVDMHANNQSETATYILYPDNKLGIGDMVHGKATIITFTATELTFDLNNTSPNGGLYFKRTYLRK